jgi:hypothetical protein
MKIIKFLKFILKLIIITTFLSERFLYYKQFKAEETKVKSIHHQLLGGWEIDFGKVDLKYDDHPLFKLPYTKKMIDKLREFVMHKMNLNQTVSHVKHTHKGDSVHTYSNKIIDVDIKFKFYFLTAHDMLVFTILLFTLITDSKIAGLFFFFDSFLKCLSVLKDPSFNQLLIHIYSAKYEKLLNYVFTEQANSLKLVNFASTFVYYFIQLIFGKKRRISDEDSINKDKDLLDMDNKSASEKNEEKDVNGHNYSKISPSMRKPVSLDNAKRDRKRGQSPSGRDKRSKGNF